MTYSQLKALPRLDLLALIHRTVSIATVEPVDPPEISDADSRALRAPIVALLGDFEIRARFPDHRREELDGDRPFQPESKETCSACRWTNVGLLNLGEPGQSRWVCQGCCKRAFEDHLKYHELLYAVARMFPRETRHQTALRYIRETDNIAAHTSSVGGNTQWLPSGSDQQARADQESACDCEP